MAHLSLPPRSCPYCLLGVCRRCTGRMVVLDVRGRGRDVACDHWYRHPTRPAADPRTAALVVMAALTPDDPALPADPGGEPC